MPFSPTRHNSAGNSTHITISSASTPPSSPRLSQRPLLSRALSCASSLGSHTQSLLEDRFAELRDAIYYSSPMPGFILSADEKFAYPNYQVGQPPEEPVEIDDVEAYFRGGWEVWDEHFTRILGFEEYPVIQLSRQRQNFASKRIGMIRDGKRIVWDNRGECIYVPGTKTFVGGVTYIQELGEYEEIQQREREQTLSCFETICDSLPHQVWTASGEGMIDYFSKSYYDFSGMTPEQSLGHGWRDGIHTDDIGTCWESFGKALALGLEEACQYRYRRHDGVYRWMSARARPLKDEHGKVLKWYGTTTDIHELVITRNEAKKLETENARLSTLEHNARESNRLKSEFLAHMSHELRTPIAGIIGMVSLLRDTKMSFEQQDFADCIKTSAGNLLTIVNDILDFSKIESGHLAIEEIPFTVSSVVDDVSKVWSHIAQQKSLTFRLDSSIPPDVQVLGDPTRIGQILSNLLSNAIKFTSAGSIKFSAEFVQQSHGIVLKMQVQDSGIGIEPNVLKNLFTPFKQGDTSTARLYGGTGLGLIISRNLSQLMGGDLVLESTYGKGTTAILTLAMKPAYQNNVSELLPLLEELSPTTVPRRRPSVIVEPKTEETFHLSPLLAHKCEPQKAGRKSPPPRLLPPAKLAPSRRTSLFPSSPTPTDERAPESALPQDTRKAVTILIVEDNAINQRIALKTAEKLGFVAKAASNGKEALDYLAAPNNVDVILMDCQMPVMDGYEATRRLREEEPYCNIQLPEKDEACWTLPYSREPRMLKDIPVIALTASAIPGDREKCYNAGMDDYLTKPLESKTLEKKLVKWAFRKSRKASNT